MSGPGAASRPIAVIGAGLAGLTLARRLQEAGRAVEVFDKSRGPGGRCATRRSPAGGFDHGAPWVQARSTAFAQALGDWAADGTLAQVGLADGEAAWVGVPTMNAWPRRLAEGLALHTEHPVAALHATATGWTLRLAGDAGLSGPFDAVLLALPAEQAAVLLSSAEQPEAEAMASALRQARSEPCWTVMAAWPGELPLAWPRWQGEDPHAPLAQAWRQDTRPGRAAEPGLASRWVLHATPHWSAHNLDARPDAVAQRLCEAFAAAAGARLARPSHVAAHRWLYAQQVQPLAAACAWDATLRLGACGDAYAGTLPSDGGAVPRGLERAWLSAQALAARLLDPAAAPPPPPPAPAG